MPLSPASSIPFSVPRGATPQSSGPAAAEPQQGAFGPVAVPPRASNMAHALLAVADVTRCGRRVGRFMADHARFATAADVGRKVAVGEIICYWSQKRVAVGLGVSERQIRRGVRSMRQASVMQVRRRERPYSATYVFQAPAVNTGQTESTNGQSVLSDVRSGVLSGVLSLKRNEPRTNEPRTNHVR